MNPPIIVWFRQDLRLTDQPALWAACETGRPIIPLFIFSDNENPNWPMGGASKWWLHHALLNLESDLLHLAMVKPIQKALNIYQGPYVEIFTALANSFHATEVYFNQAMDPYTEAVDQKTNAALGKLGITMRRFASNLLLTPKCVRKADGSSYQIFTPFYKSALKISVPAPLPSPLSLNLYQFPDSMIKPSPLLVNQLNLIKTKGWSQKLNKHWIATSGNLDPNSTLMNARHIAQNYEKSRDFPSQRGTSRLSPFLHFGQISPRQVYHAIHQDDSGARAQPFIRQLFWREFAIDQLFECPWMDKRPLRKEFQNFPYEQDDDLIHRWQQGLTGYPIIDAAMRELWETGFMHNRCRMIVGSFLVKDLLCPWQSGAQWFWDTLVDADLANNSMGWQWISGCGIDAAPYFRIFNPTLQSQKFDPDGHYIRTYVPELRGLSAKDIHAPWLAEPASLKKSNVILGKTYPHPMIDHKKAQLKALIAYEKIKTKKIKTSKMLLDDHA